MNGIGERLKAQGLQFGYHNHDFEFQSQVGGAPMSILLERTDPDLVTFELDVYWAAYAQADPAAYLSAHPGRFRLCHVKDMDRFRQMVDVGDGQLDFGRIFNFAQRGGLEHFFVEHDAPTDPEATVRRSQAYLSALRF